MCQKTLMSIDPLQAIQDRTLDIWRRYIRTGEPVALLDHPSHTNAGDTLIYAGERAYLDRLGVPVRYLTDHVRYSADELRRRHPEGIILLHGGGNLGDRWPDMQRFRERVIKDFPDRSIVQLPQSMEFRDPARLEKARKIFGTHPALTILLRETPSFEAGQKAFSGNDVVYCPDAAFGVGYLEPLQKPQHDVVMVLRRDSEAVERGIGSAIPGAKVMDWDLSGASYLAWKALSIHKGLTKRFGENIPHLYPVIEREFAARTSLNMTMARRMISSGRILVTDRLHATVFAALTRRPAVCLDNVYGKISSIYREYLHALPGIKYVNSAEEARQAVEVELAKTRRMAR